MKTSELWVFAAITGQSKYAASSFGRASLLGELRLEIQKVCDGAEVTSSAVPEESEDYDPMAEVEQVDEDAQKNAKTRGRGQKRTRYYKNLVTKKVVSLDMPVRCREEDPNCTEVRKIRVYIEDRKQIWLDLADVEWAARYLYIQNLLKGAPLIPEDSTGPCPAP